MEKKVVKGSLEAIILQLLEVNGRMYGYEMTRKARELTSGKICITEAALYPALHRLVENDVLETVEEHVDGRLRKYYQLTRKGKKERTQLIAAWKESVAALQLILNSQPQKL